MTNREHYINDITLPYFSLLPVTPPERITGLAFDCHGDIRLDSPSFRHYSPPPDSDNEELIDPAHRMCASPPGETDTFDPEDMCAPSPPGSSDTRSVDSWRDCVSVSEGSPSEVLMGIGTQSPEAIDSVVLHSLGNGSSPPVPQAYPDPASAILLMAPWSPVGQAPSPPSSDASLDRPVPPAASPPNSDSPEIYTPPPIPKSTQHDAISVGSTSPSRAFPWPTIPASLSHHFTIPYGQSVLDLVHVDFQPQSICTKRCCQPRFVSADSVLDGERAVSILQTLPLPGRSSIDRALERWTVETEYNAVEIRHDNDRRAFAPWVLTVWRDFVAIYPPLTLWHKAVEDLEVRGDLATLEYLKDVCWNSKCTIPDASLHGVGRLGTKHWLNDDSMAVLLYMVNLRLQDGTSRILSCLNANYIRVSWQDFKKNGIRTKRKWVTRLYEDLLDGTVTTLGFCVNVMAGGGPHEKGNHWIGVVIDAARSIIHVGDSQEYPPHPQVIEMIRWFLQGVSQQVFSIQSLPSSVQPGNWSCGEYSVNMVAHYFLPDIYRFPGSRDIDATEHRIGLFKDAVDIIRQLVRRHNLLPAFRTEVLSSRVSMDYNR